MTELKQGILSKGFDAVVKAADPDNSSESISVIFSPAACLCFCSREYNHLTLKNSAFGYKFTLIKRIHAISVYAEKGREDDIIGLSLADCPIGEKILNYKINEDGEVTRVVSVDLYSPKPRLLRVEGVGPLFRIETYLDKFIGYDDCYIRAGADIMPTLRKSIYYTDRAWDATVLPPGVEPMVGTYKTINVYGMYNELRSEIQVFYGDFFREKRRFAV